MDLWILLGIIPLESLKQLTIGWKGRHSYCVGFSDHYGRLMGKRFEATYFVEPHC